MTSDFDAQPPTGPVPTNVVPFPAPTSVLPPPVLGPGTPADQGQLLTNALLALWWGYGWQPGIGSGELGPQARPLNTAWMGFDPNRRYPRWGIPDAALALFAFLIGTVVFAFPTVLVTSDLGVLNIMGLLGSWVGAVAYLVFVSRVKGQGRLSLDFGFRAKWIDLPIGLGVAIVTLIASQIVRLAVAAVFDAPVESNSDAIFSGQDSAAGVIILALMAAIGAPIVEELLFRGLGQRSIDKRFGAVAGVVGSALVFGLLHWQPADAIGTSLSLVAGITTYGVIFAIADRWVGRLAPSITAHFLLNSMAAALTVSSYFSGTTFGK